jgi:hypothetical protein
MLRRLAIFIVAGLARRRVVGPREVRDLPGRSSRCGLGTGEVVIGTQVADEPRHADTSIRFHSLQGTARPFVDRARPAERGRIELQDIGTDPSLCRRIGNESYCY